MAGDDVTRMLLETLANLGTRTQEIEEEKNRQNTRMDAIAEMALQTTQKLNFLEGEGEMDPPRHFDESRGLKIYLPEFDGA